MLSGAISENVSTGLTFCTCKTIIEWFSIDNSDIPTTACTIYAYMYNRPLITFKTCA